MDRFYEFCKYSAWKVGISFSGGADSTVLLDLFCKFWEANKEEHGNAPLLVAYANTSNEFATMPGHVRAFCAYMQLKYDIEIDLRIVKAKENFFDVCKDIGYPVASKKVAGMVSGIRADLKRLNIDWKDIEYKIDNGAESAELLREMGLTQTSVLNLTGMTTDNREAPKYKLSKKWRILITAPFEVSNECCSILKKSPIKAMENEVRVNSIFATLAEDSEQREAAYLKHGCIQYGRMGHSKSTPLGFWLRKDILEHLYREQLPIAPPYGELVKEPDGTLRFTGEENTGCKLCLFGCHLEPEPNRIQRLSEIEPATYEFAMKPVSEGGLGYQEVMKYCGIPFERN